MQMILGLFPFTTNTIDPQSWEISTNERHASNDVVGARNPRQHIGPGDETITLDGIMYPEEYGHPLGFEVLGMMMKTGKAWILINGTGRVMGFYQIDDISQSRSEFIKNGAARKIEFSLTLTRVDSPLSGLLGNLLDFIPGVGSGGGLSIR